MSLLPKAKTLGKVFLEQIRLLLYGPPKIGKTTLASGFSNAIFLATEKGYESIKIFKTDIKKWEDFQDVSDELLKGKHNFKTVVVDTGDILWSHCVDYMCEKMDIEHPSDEDWGKGYAMIRSEFEREINKLFMSDLGLIIISHTKEVEIKNKMSAITKTVPTLPNQARNILIPKVSLIGYMGVETVKVGEKQYREQRFLSFAPSEILEAGDRDGKLPLKFTVFKDPLKTYKVFEEAYAK